MTLIGLADATPRVLWHDSVNWSAYERDLPVPTEVDVAIIGGGFTGLWTALWLKEFQPSLSIAILEREHIGFGASSRNGGWCSAAIPTSMPRLTQISDATRARAAAQVMQSMVREFGQMVNDLGIDCDFKQSGTFVAARSPVQEQRARAEVIDARQWGAADSDLQWLPAMSAARIAAMDQLLGGTFTPHCASINPAKLVVGLAAEVHRRGVMIHEEVTVASHDEGTVRTSRGIINAQVVVRATEGYTGSMQQYRRSFAPVFSLMLATAPLPADVLDAIALPPGMTFADYRHLVIYGQRTADNRIAFGGRGAPYHFGSRIDARFDQNSDVHTGLHRILVGMFPQLRDIAITHTWGGALAVPRDWTVSMGFDRARKYAWSGGYLGDGVAMSFVGGRLLAELISGKTSALSQLPWIGHESRNWELEPWRFIGITGGLKAMTWADAAEARTGRPSRIAEVINRSLGRH